MADVRIEIKGGEELTKLADGFVKEVQDQLNAALEATLKEGVQIVKQTIREANAVASGKLLNSTSSRMKSQSEGNWEFWGEIYFHSIPDKYVEGADVGRGAGKQPPIEHIRAWVRQKGLDERLAYPIARSIGLSGTNVAGWSRFGRKSFLEPAARKIDVVAQREFDKIALRLQRRLDANANNNSGRS